MSLQESARANGALARHLIPLAEWKPWSPNQWFPEGCGFRVGGGIVEWTEAAWRPLGAAGLGDLRHVLVEARVSGRAGAAGFSFGAFKDFLAVPDGARSLLLQLEIDHGGSWRFRIEGVLQTAQWWNSAVERVEDLWREPLLLKARWPKDAYFGELGLYRLASGPKLSVIVTCYRYAQRLRAILANWCSQDADPGAYEVLIVNPGSTDATHEVVAAAAAAFPTVRLAEISSDPVYWRNKGVMINLAAKAAQADWVLLTDADCLFDQGTVSRILQFVAGGARKVFYGERRHLTMRATQAVLAGAISAVSAFGDLASGEAVTSVDRSPWGYAQLIPRDVLRSVRYREDIDHYAHTDELFIAACNRQGLAPQFFRELVCLHLEHPFSWYGTEQFL